MALNTGELEVEGVDVWSVVVYEDGEAFGGGIRERKFPEGRLGGGGGVGWCMCTAQNTSSCRASVEHDVAWCQKGR